MYSMVLFHIEEMWNELIISGNQKIPFQWNHWTPIVHFKETYCVSDQLKPLLLLHLMSFLVGDFFFLAYYMLRGISVDMLSRTWLTGCSGISVWSSLRKRRCGCGIQITFHLGNFGMGKMSHGYWVFHFVFVCATQSNTPPLMALLCRSANHF